MPASALDHRTQNRVCGIHRAEEIDVYQCFDRIGSIFTGLHVITTDAGVGDEDVDAAKLSAKRIGRLLQRGRVRDIARENPRTSTRHLTTYGQSFEQLGSPGDQR